jgi:DNA polymerase sigma
MLLDLPDFSNFTTNMISHFEEISLSGQDITERKDLISFVKNKLKNKNYQGADISEISYYDTGLDIEVFGSYAAGLSTKRSDLDMRVNDFYTYRWLNLDKISQNLIHDPQEHLNIKWTGPKKSS